MLEDRMLLSGFTVTDLKTLGGAHSEAYGINDSGQVVGWANTASTVHAFLYGNGKMTDLGTLPGGNDSFAAAINNSGQVVGRADVGGGCNHAFRDTNGKMTDLGTFGGGSSYAYGINDSGEVVGEAYYATGGYFGNGASHAFLYSDLAGAMTDLGTLGDSDCGSSAYGINEHGEIVGWSEITPGGAGHAFLYSVAAGTMADLETLGGSNSFASDVNESGQIVGWADTADGYTHAFLYANGGMTDLGTLTGYNGWSYATSINNEGQVVGWANGVAGGSTHAFLYSNGKMTDLGTLGGSDSYAWGINDFGQIVGQAAVDNTHNHAVLWQAKRTNTSALLAASPNPSVYGQSVTFTAIVSPTVAGTGVPTGTMTFADGSITLGSSAISTTNGVTSATFPIDYLAAGTHKIVATYSGDGSFGPSGSRTIKQKVNKAVTNTMLATSLSPSIFGQEVTFTATVNVLTPGSGTPTGSVTFKDGSKTLGTGKLSIVNGVATAKFATSKLTVGSHKITAVYSGDLNFKTSTSAAVPEVVAKASTSAKIGSSANPSTSGQKVTFAVSVEILPPGSGTPTGTVTFKEGSKTLGTGKLSTANGVTTATFTTHSLAVGSHDVTASYAGNGSFNGSVSIILTQVVNGSPLRTLAFLPLHSGSLVTPSGLDPYQSSTSPTANAAALSVDDAALLSLMEAANHDDWAEQWIR